MERTRPHSYILIGMLLQGLVTIKEGSSAEICAKNIGSLIKRVDEQSLRVTKGVALNLEEIKDKLEEKEPDYKITSDDVSRIQNELKSINASLASEAKLIMLFKTTERNLDVNRLYENPQQFLSEGVWEMLPELSQYDLEQSAKAIVYGLPTAAAFQILRATESVLSDYYEYFIRQKRISEDKRTWGNMTEALREKKGGRRPSSAVILHLDDIRKNYRNPTAHPHAKYDIEESQTLFIMCCEAIRRMVNDKAAK